MTEENENDLEQKIERHTTLRDLSDFNYNKLRVLTREGLVQLISEIVSSYTGTDSNELLIRVTDLDLSNQQLRTKLQDMELHRKQLEADRQRLIGENETSTAEKKELAAELNGQSAELIELQTASDKLSDELQRRDGQLVFLGDRISELQKDCDREAKRNLSIQSQMEATARANAEQLNRFEEERRRDYENFNTQQRALELELEAAMKQRESMLQSEYQRSLERQQEATAALHSEDRSARDQLESELQRLQEELERARGQAREIEDQLHTVRNDHQSRFQGQLALMRGEFEKQARHALEEVRNERVRLEADREAQRAKQQEFQSRVEKKQTAHFKDMERLREDLALERQKEQELIERYRRERDDLQVKVVASERILELKNERLEDLEKVYQEVRQEFFDFQQSERKGRHELESELQKVEEQLAQAQAKSQQDKDALRAAHKKAAEAERAQGDLRSTIESLCQERDDLKSRIEALTKELEDQAIAHKAAIEELMLTIKLLRRELAFAALVERDFDYAGLKESLGSSIKLCQERGQGSRALEECLRRIESNEQGFNEGCRKIDSKKGHVGILANVLALSKSRRLLSKVAVLFEQDLSGSQAQGGE
jgi:chromosome segregation ATPase